MQQRLPHASPSPSSVDDARTLCFTLNGQPITIANPDPRLLLADYLRSPEVGLTGTKIGCGEGGCGACTVLLQRRDPLTGDTVMESINSCLRPLCSLDGMAISTVEHLGTTRSGLHPVQQRLAAANGSQCGYCTPGFVVQMTGLLRRTPSLPRARSKITSTATSAAARVIAPSSMP
ncbi:Xanthine dehydrogenase, iron-sulfur cluster and FAD-binding subunit A [Minicystis rosea]|nr:Xanthine dehydrogenase, iron-sulfur cluster and FAD-binding subunit A [Minicystis rosea]